MLIYCSFWYVIKVFVVYPGHRVAPPFLSTAEFSSCRPSGTALVYTPEKRKFHTIVAWISIRIFPPNSLTTSLTAYLEPNHLTADQPNRLKADHQPNRLTAYHQPNRLTADKPNRPTAEQPNSLPAYQPTSLTAYQPNRLPA